MKRLILLAHIFLAQLLLADPLPQTRTAVFAGGCFWCIQPAFDKAPGVIKTVVGYCGGTEPNPTYALVGSEKTNYRESIEVTYDPAKINFDQLLDIYWRQINPDAIRRPVHRYWTELSRRHLCAERRRAKDRGSIKGKAGGLWPVRQTDCN